MRATSACKWQFGERRLSMVLLRAHAVAAVAAAAHHHHPCSLLVCSVSLLTFPPPVSLHIAGTLSVSPPRITAPSSRPPLRSSSRRARAKGGAPSICRRRPRPARRPRRRRLPARSWCLTMARACRSRPPAATRHPPRRSCTRRLLPWKRKKESTRERLLALTCLSFACSSPPLGTKTAHMSRTRTAGGTCARRKATPYL